MSSICIAFCFFLGEAASAVGALRFLGGGFDSSVLPVSNMFSCLEWNDGKGTVITRDRRVSELEERSLRGTRVVTPTFRCLLWFVILPLACWTESVRLHLLYGLLRDRQFIFRTSFLLNLRIRSNASRACSSRSTHVTKRNPIVVKREARSTRIDANVVQMDAES